MIETSDLGIDLDGIELDFFPKLNGESDDFFLKYMILRFVRQNSDVTISDIAEYFKTRRMEIDIEKIKELVTKLKCPMEE